MSDANPEPKPPSRPKPGAVLIGFLVLLVGEILILSNSGLSMPEILPKPISTYAKNVDALFYVILWVTGFFFFLTQALLVYFLLKYKDRGGRAVHTHGNHALELAWTFIPGLILFCLAVFQTGTWGMIKFKNAEEFPSQGDPGVVTVQVFAKQFEWHFRYADDEGNFGTADSVAKLGKMYVPVDRKILVQLQTHDVLHSFWLPNVRLKQDLLPGQTIPQWFECTETGVYEVVCAELCGNLHTAMRAELHVVTEEEYRAWLAQERKDFGPFVAEDHPLWKHWRN